MIVGITGTNGSGKGMIVDFLKERGFKHYSARALLAETLGARNLEVTRENLINIANELRGQQGAEYVAKTLFERAQEEGGNIVIESLRVPAEAKYLEGQKDFYFIGVDAIPELRYQRISERQSTTDRISFEEFMRLEQQEMFSSDPLKQNLAGCTSFADYLVQNNGGLDELLKDFEKGKKGFMNLFGEGRRPDREELWMRRAYDIGHMTRCLRREVGAIFVRDDIAISEGYNGPPRGSPHCKDLGGCVRAKRNVPSGERQELCRGGHAESNGVANAAFNGISLKGATCYVTTFPCVTCTKILINAGVTTIVYNSSYNDELSAEMIEESPRIDAVKFSGVTPRGYVKFWR